MSQDQDMLSLKVQEQLLDYRDVSHLLCLLLSSAENYAMKKNPEKIFGYYDEYDNTNFKDDEGLLKQFLTELECFRRSFLYYINKYHKYDYPKKLNFLMIKNLVDKWKTLTNGEPLYDEIIYILSDENKSKSHFEDLKRLKKNIPKEKEQKEVQNMASNFIGINHSLNKYENDVIKDYVETQKFNFNVVLNGKPGRALQQVSVRYTEKDNYK